jgi:hypothetical protein
MPSPFPGMDPYLEHPVLWPDVHNSLIAALRDELASRLRPRYIVAIEERVYLITPEGAGWPIRADIAVTLASQALPEAGRLAPLAQGARVVEVPLPETLRETYLEVRAAGTGEVITVVEILSPTNKRAGEPRRLYEQKRTLLLGSRTHLVEIDLLRSGEPMPVMGDGRDGHYRILISRWEQRPRALLYVFTVRDPIPTFRLPLLPGDEEPEVDLGRLLQNIYERAAYDLRVRYEEEPVPPLEPPFAEWAAAMLREKGHRRQ